MAAHRYWRLMGLEAYGFSGLALTEMQLIALGGSRVDASATLTSNIAPTSGSLANLKDNDLATGAAWALDATVKALVFTWDFGAGNEQDVVDIKLGSAAGLLSDETFLAAAILQYSDDGVTWAGLVMYPGIAHPGASAFTATQARPDQPADGSFAFVDALYSFEDDPRAAIFDQSNFHRQLTLVGAAARVATAKFGAKGLQTTTGTYTLITTAGSTPAPSLPSVAAGDSVTMECWCYQTSRPILQTMVSFNNGASDRMDISITAAGLARTWYMVAGLPYQALGTTVLALNTWHHIAAVRRANVIEIYVNGVLEQASACTVYLSATTKAPYIGTDGIAPTTTNFVGFLDDVRISRWAQYTGSNFTPSPEGLCPTRIALNRGYARRNAVPFRVPPGTPQTSGFSGAYRRDKRAGASPKYNYQDPPKGTGLGRVQGVVKDDAEPDVPVYRRVRLHRQRDGQLVQEQWSDKVTGSYDFQYVDEMQTYYVIAFDHNNNFRAVIADRIAPTLLLA